MRTLLLTLTTCLLFLPVQAKYSGGSGTAQDPYQIATAADLIALGDTPNDYYKHFILTADIDLDPKLPGRKIFDKAVIAPDTNDANWDFDGTPFTGVFDGNGHTVSHLTIAGASYVGLFGRLESGAAVSGLGVVDVNIVGTHNCVAGLVACNGSWTAPGGAVTQCYSSGVVGGGYNVGGLTGLNTGTVAQCYSTTTVRGAWGAEVGGLVGSNGGSITASCSAGTVSGTDSFVGGLVGDNGGSIAASYSSSRVDGETGAGESEFYVGGLVGGNWGSITGSYSTGPVSSTSLVGGLVGGNWGSVATSFWDTQTSGQTASAGGIGKTTAQMQTAGTFLDAGWDFVEEVFNGLCDYWQIAPGGYPRLHYEGGNRPVMPEGLGTAEQPYLIRDARDLATVWSEPLAHYRLTQSIDLSGTTWSMAVIPWFGGVFDGGGYVIRGVHIQGGGYLGLFGVLGSTANVRNSGLEGAEVNGTGNYVGSLAGRNSGRIATCYSSSSVSGMDRVGSLVGYNDGSIVGSSSSGSTSATGSSYGASFGGLVGYNEGSIATCYSSGSTSGTSIGLCTSFGGLAGYNEGSIAGSSSSGPVSGVSYVGGLVGHNEGRIAASYSRGPVSGVSDVGGLVGYNEYGSIAASYSSGPVSGTGHGVGGLVGVDERGSITTSFWDTQTSSRTTSAGGTGKTTAQMQTVGTFLEAGWDFVDEVLNGVCEYWQIEAGGYPRLRHESGNRPAMPEGLGTAEQPYLIRDARDLGTVWCEPLAHYRLAQSIDLSGTTWSMAVIPWFGGVFDGGGCIIRGVHIQGGTYLGLFGVVNSTASVRNLGLEGTKVSGTGDYVGTLAGRNSGKIATCYSSGSVSGVYYFVSRMPDYWGYGVGYYVGGLVGHNDGSIVASSSRGSVSGTAYCVGGLVGHNDGNGSIVASYSRGPVSGREGVGGLVGFNGGRVTQSHSTSVINGLQGVGGLVASNKGIVADCCSAGVVDGNDIVGGLAGYNGGTITDCYSIGSVTGRKAVGGLVGSNSGIDLLGGGGHWFPYAGEILHCYAAGSVSGDEKTGGLVGSDDAGGQIKGHWHLYLGRGQTNGSFWDLQASGQSWSDGGTGKTTAQMQTAKTFLEAGWDFVGETANGTEDIWWILEGKDYPHLWWEAQN